MLFFRSFFFYSNAYTNKYKYRILSYMKNALFFTGNHQEINLLKYYGNYGNCGNNEYIMSHSYYYHAS